jgi:hypothetical protein
MNRSPNIVTKLKNYTKRNKIKILSPKNILKEFIHRNSESTKKTFTFEENINAYLYGIEDNNIFIKIIKIINILMLKQFLSFIKTNKYLEESIFDFNRTKVLRQKGNFDKRIENILYYIVFIQHIIENKINQEIKPCMKNIVIEILKIMIFFMTRTRYINSENKKLCQDIWSRIIFGPIIEDCL